MWGISHSTLGWHNRSTALMSSGFDALVRVLHKAQILVVLIRDLALAPVRTLGFAGVAFART
ncbi:hypothetical protein ACQY0O_003426 [Thecaphora frezii]